MKIHADHQPYRKKPYAARWYEGSRQRNKFLASTAARDEYIEQLKLTAQRQDPTLHELAPHQLIRWQQAMEIDPDADPVKVFKFWKAEQKKISELGDRYLKDAAAGYIKSMELMGRNTFERHLVFSLPTKDRYEFATTGQKLDPLVIDRSGPVHLHPLE